MKSWVIFAVSNSTWQQYTGFLYRAVAWDVSVFSDILVIFGDIYVWTHPCMSVSDIYVWTLPCMPVQWYLCLNAPLYICPSITRIESDIIPINEKKNRYNFDMRYLVLRYIEKLSHIGQMICMIYSHYSSWSRCFRADTFLICVT